MIQLTTEQALVICDFFHLAEGRNILIPDKVDRVWLVMSEQIERERHNERVDDLKNELILRNPPGGESLKQRGKVTKIRIQDFE